MATQTALPFTFLEEISAEISWAFKDESDTAITPPDLLAVTLTLYDVASGQIINLREDQDILGGDKSGLNDVDISETGVATWYMQPEDNLIVIPGANEQHVALVEWTWNPDDGHGIRQGRFEIQIVVHNLNKVP